MDKVRARKMAADLRGKAVSGWVVGDYLGNGYSAVVLSADRAGQKGALKIIDPEMVERWGPDHQRVRILREKQLVEHRHPNLVEIFDGGECASTGHLFITMELLAPNTLTKRLRRVPRERIGSLIGQLAEAARFLDGLSIAHRDIKPDNTVLTDNYESIKLLDLGVIRPHVVADDASAGTGDRFVGTARYSPPEYLYSEVEDSSEGWRAVTFYQLGATLHDMLMRRRMFADVGEPPAKLYDAIKHTVPPIDAPDVDPWLVDLAKRCLHKDWKVRIQLVDWEDFERPRYTDEGAESIKERLKQRQSLIPPKDGLSAIRAESKPSRQALLRLGDTVTPWVREACHDSGIFPPTEVRCDITNVGCLVLVCADPSPSHELAAALEVRFDATPLDPLISQVRITGAAALGIQTAGSEAVELFVGELGDAKCRERVEAYLYASLEAALGAGVPQTGGVSLRPAVGRNK